MNNDEILEKQLRGKGYSSDTSDDESYVDENDEDYDDVDDEHQ
jgi:hypothetical protein